MKKLLILSMLFLTACTWSNTASNTASTSVLNAKPAKTEVVWQGKVLAQFPGTQWLISNDQALLVTTFSNEEAPYLTLIAYPESHASEIQTRPDVITFDQKDGLVTATYDSEWDGESIFLEGKMANGQFLDLYAPINQREKAEQVFNSLIQ